MEKAISVLGKTPYLNHTMIKGPRATFGIMFNVTSSGSTRDSSSLDQVNTSARPTPTTSASA